MDFDPEMYRVNEAIGMDDDFNPEMFRAGNASPARIFGIPVNASKPAVDTIIGKMQPLQSNEIADPESINEMIGWAAGAPGVGQGLRAVSKSVMTLPEAVNLLRSKVDPKELIKNIQRGHDSLKSYSAGLYNKVKDAALDRNVGDVPVTQKLTKLLDDAKEYMPKTKAFQELFKKAENGSYEAIHKMQSSIGDRIRRLKSSKNIADQDMGEILDDHREELIDTIKDHFNKTGHPDLANDWQEARESYRKLHEIYYPKKAPMIGRIVHEESRAIPKNPLSFLSTESKPMERLFQQHPEIKEGVDTYNKKRELINKLTTRAKIAGGSALGYEAIRGGKTLWDFIKGNE